jgi:AcrR family transcriptional regulator
VAEPFTREPTFTPSGARDRTAYFAAAYALLGERGADGVTIAALCERLNVTKGSFYHHFTDMPGFLEAFALHWKSWLYERIADFEAIGDPARRLEKIANSLDLVSGSQAAIRAWAGTNPVLAATFQDVHQPWNALLARTIGQIVGDPELGLVLQALALAIGVGIELRAQPLDGERFLRVEQEISRRCFALEFELVRIHDRPVLELRGPASLRPHAVEAPHPLPAGLKWAEADPWPHAGEVVPGQRIRGREAWFAAAREILAGSGSDALTVDALCRRLSVTKGSFNWHFENMPQFLQAFAEHWEHTHDRLLAGYREEPDPMTRLARLQRQMLAAPDQAETAIRAWAHTEPVIGHALRRIDRRKQDLNTATIHAATGDPDAELLAEMMLSLAIGLREAEHPRVEPDLAARIVMKWATNFLRLDAELHEEDGKPVITLNIPADRSRN